MSVAAARAGAFLTIDLGAVVSNWRLMAQKAAPAVCAAVVKADSYGLGATEVSSALETAGCRTFFVAHVEEGIRLRTALGERSRIFVLNGTPPGTEADFVGAGLTPVINTRGELAAWTKHARRAGHKASAALQVDSGMSRLGLSPADVEAIAADSASCEGINVQLVMSHLACADDPANPANAAQCAQFERLRAMLPPAPASLANSSGVMLGEAFRFDLVRPGAAMYGINPTPHAANPVRPVVKLEARVVQVREVGAGTGVGYGHALSTRQATKLATVSLGYADGWPRNATGAAFFRGQRLPLAGRVSMDSIIVDISGAAQPPREGDSVEMIGPDTSVDDVAANAGTIGYEILTRLGRRFHRRYLTPDA